MTNAPRCVSFPVPVHDEARRIAVEHSTSENQVLRLFIVLGFWLWRELGQDADKARMLAAEAMRSFAAGTSARPSLETQAPSALGQVLGEPLFQRRDATGLLKADPK
jgi:hypothetical protein